MLYMKNIYYSHLESVLLIIVFVYNYFVVDIPPIEHNNEQ